MIISFELARKLKEVGFQQDTYFYWVVMNGKQPSLYDRTMMGDYIGTEKPIEVYSAPTLSELIEACGRGVVLWHDLTKDIWCAGVLHEERNSDIHIDDYPSTVECGEYPDEAVANLWLVLNGR